MLGLADVMFVVSGSLMVIKLISPADGFFVGNKRYSFLFLFYVSFIL